MDITYVIVNYNVKDYLLECLASVYAVDSFPYEVIVVDNASKDESLKAVREKYPQTIIIENSQNRGFPAANNQAFKIAKGKYIFMLNPDAALTGNAASSLLSFMEKNPETDIIAPQLLNTDGSLQQSVWRFPTIASIFSEMYYLKTPKKNYDDIDKSKIFEPESFSGAAIMFRRSVIDSIGMLDEFLFWIEDIDFCFRAKKAGMKLVYYPEASVIHHISKSAKTNYKISVSSQVFNKIKFYKKHKGFFKYFIIVLISLQHAFFKLFVFLFLSPFSRIYWLKAKAYAYTLTRIFNPPRTIFKPKNSSSAKS